MTMPDKIKVIEDVERLYEIVPDNARDNVDALFSDLILRIRSSIDFELIRDQLNLIPRFSERADKGETAISFFKRNYAALLASPHFFADDLRRYDGSLYTTLSSYQAERQKRMADLVPLRPRATRGNPKPPAALALPQRHRQPTANFAPEP